MKNISQKINLIRAETKVNVNSHTNKSKEM